MTGIEQLILAGLLSAIYTGTFVYILIKRRDGR